METTDTPPPKERRWPIALLVAFISAIIAVVAVVPIAEWGMEDHHVSTMEGGRGYAMLFCWMPLALAVAFLTGFVVSLMTAGRGFAGYLKRQGIALGVLTLLFGLAAALSYATAEHPPLIDGKALALEIEVRVPAKGRTIAELRAQGFDVALAVSASDRHYSDMRWSEAMQTDAFIIVPAWARLHSRNADRQITAGFRGMDRQSFNVLLGASPKQVDEAWSEWTGADQRFDGSKPAPDEQYFARYRVRFADEYEPTPAPTPTPSADDVTEPPPEETAAEPAESP